MEDIMSELELQQIRIRQRERFEAFERGDLRLPWFLRPCAVKILMVVDGYPGNFLNVSFSHSYFGLSAVLDALRSQPDFYVRYDVTRAHRQTDTFKPDQQADPQAFQLYGPHFEGFRFNQPGFSLDGYDQVWLFGARAEESGSEALQPGELEVLAKFMEAGGGVFATGDHADLGASLCSTIPRVRSMRKWTNAQGVPQNFGPDRHDTNDKGHDSTFTFDDESDDKPMTISPKFYSISSHHKFLRRSAPHPVLCGRDGVIDILPDHPHEGEILDTNQINLGGTFSAGSIVNAAEFPTKNGNQESPEVIAWAHVQSGHTSITDTNKGEVNTKTFGAIGAYDGHKCDVGRIVVDSTWHHWFDVNLIGRPVARLDSAPFDATNPKTQGFEATPAGQAALERIYNYFRNVALWCSPPQKQSCLFLKATWGLVIRYPAAEQLDPSLPVFLLGGVAYDAIGRAASQCIRTRWIFDWFLVDLEQRIKKIPDGCLSCPPYEVIEKYILGGVTREILEETRKMQRKVDSEPNEARIASRVLKGVDLGLSELSADLEKSIENMRSFVESLSIARGSIPDAKKFFSMDEPK
jgi:hypothetical protein